VDSVIGERDYRLICALVGEHSRIHLGPQKREFVASRVRKRLRALGLSDIKAYGKLLRSPGASEEIPHLVNVISTNVTHFFREMKHFQFLKDVIVSKWLQEADTGPTPSFRIWSAASATGEEPYSLAILLSEALRDRPGSWQVEASDISTHALAAATRGIYERQHLKLVSPEWLGRYFQQGTGEWTGHYRIKDSLRPHVRFHHVNLFQPGYPFPPGFHAIFCRNVMIYFDRPTQEELLQRLSRNLLPGGFLVVGHAESLATIPHSLENFRPSIARKPL